MDSSDFPSLEELAVLLPQYRFEQLLAEGGMGAVYRAEQISLARPVAIKILPRTLSADETYREQFKTEARLMGSLTCPQIVNIHDFGQAGDLLYIVMELLEGTNLYQRMRQEPLKQPEVVKVLAQACDALTAAHNKGVVHRDVKPENIFIEPGLRVKLGDFGIARMRRTDADGATQASVSGVRLGTPEYAAPELFDFQKHIDQRADLFSLGVVLYELLTGARPTGSFIAPSQRKPGIDKRFDAVVVRAMQSEPADRYASAEEMKKDLLKVLQAGPQPARAGAVSKTPTGQKGARPEPPAAPKGPAKVAAKESPAAKAKPPSKKNPALLWGSVIGAAAAAGILVAVLNRGDDQKKNGAAAILDATSTPPENPFKDDVIKPGPSAVTTPPPPRQPGPPAKKLTHGGHTYQYLPSRLNWNEARAQAESQGGHLATITSQEEYDVLRTYLLPLVRQNNDCCWLGASDAEAEGTWKWITGEPFEFKVWGPNAPSNGSDGKGPQNFLAWQKQTKYGVRQIEWNDLPDRIGDSAVGGALIEWDKAEESVPPAVVVKPPDKPMPVETPSTPPVPTVPAVAASPGQGWQPITWSEADIQKLAGRVALTDGWCVSSTNATLEAPPAAGFIDGAVRLRVRIDSEARLIQIKPRYAKADALICSLDMPGSIKVFRRDNGTSTVLADWPLADRLQPGDEVRLEMSLVGKTMTVKFNGTAVGSIDTGDTSMAKALRFMANGVAMRDIEYLPLDGITEPDKALAAPSAWPAGSELAAELVAFSQKKDAAYAAKLSASIKSLRESYARRLREVAAQKPADAAVLNAEAAFVTDGGDPPSADTPGTPAALTSLRKTWQEAKAGMEKPVADAALTLWREHLATLGTMEAKLRQAHKLADAADIAPHRIEAEGAVAHFVTLAPKSAKPEAAPVSNGGFPLQRPSIPGKLVAWRRSKEVTHDMGAAEIPGDIGPVVALAAGPDFALALRPDGTVMQWGTTFAKQSEPPAGLKDVVAIDAGFRFAAALRSDGSIVAWGPDYRGNLVPPGLQPAVAISVGEFHGHALHADGTVSYFGFPAGDNPKTWAPPATFTGIKAMDAGKEVTCGLKGDGTIVFAGTNVEKQITGVPPKLKPVTLVACGRGVCCVLAGGDTLHFWGHATTAKDADYARGSIRFPAVKLSASAFSNVIAARNAEGEWKFFGDTDSIDLRESAKQAKGALDVKRSKDHLLALMPLDPKK